jgi:diacylglycerol O-acyltransferase
MYGRSGLANALPPVANVAVSNVPGAPVPLYVCGALMKTYFPVSIPTHGVGLNITVQSYNGSLDYGLIACRRAVPDIADLADYMVEEHRKLYDLAMKLPVEGAKVETAKPVAAPDATPVAATANIAKVRVPRATKKATAKKSTKKAAKKAAPSKKASTKSTTANGKAAPVAASKATRKPRASTPAVH